jgi:hypothetical protein
MSDISLRDHFAGLAMQAWVSAGAFNQAAEDMLKKAGIKGTETTEGFLAHTAYAMADAMLKERGEDEPKPEPPHPPRGGAIHRPQSCPHNNAEEWKPGAVFCHDCQSDFYKEVKDHGR